MRHIPLAICHLTGKEEEFVNCAIKSNWIAPLGPDVDAFEGEIVKFTQSNMYPLATCSGTSAIHLALIAAGVKKNDIVISSDMTFAATCNPAVYQGAKLVFVDSNPETFNMDPDSLEIALQKYPNAKAVLLAHLYGQPADMDKIVAICNKYNVILIEDAAEALGSSYHNQLCGTFGNFGIFSFNGNKIITTSGGGMLLGYKKEEINHARNISTQARKPAYWYQHEELGYNYRLSNVCAALGRAQLLDLERRVEIKRRIFDRYAKAFEGSDVYMMPHDVNGSFSNSWLSALLIKPSCSVSPIQILEFLKERNIETRPIWKPMHMQPFYKDCDFVTSKGKPMDEDLFYKGLCLPSDIEMTEEEQNYVISCILECIRKYK